MTTISITEDLIKNSKRYEADACPNSLAINAVLKDEYRSVCYTLFTIVKVENKAPVYQQALPTQVREWTFSYDRGEEVEPISYEVDIPEKFLK